MRRALFTLSLAAVLGSGAVTAQSTAPTRPASTPSAHEETKLTGCLKEALTSAASASPDRAKQFVLEVMPPRDGMPTETPDRTTRAPEKETYALMAMGGVDLSKHVNHLVELSGTKAKMSETRTASTPSSSGSMRATGPGEHPMFHVTALKMVSTNCNRTSQ